MVNGNQNVLRYVIFSFLALLTLDLRASSMAELEKIIEKADSFETFLKRTDLLQEYKTALQLYYGEDKFGCDSFEKIVEELKELNRTVEGFGDRVWRRAPVEDNFTFHQFSEPSRKRRERVASYQLRSLPRRIHGIWNDPSGQSCGAQDCSKAVVSAPQRWAVMVSNSELYLMEKDGKYLGSSIMVLPMVKGDKTYDLVTRMGRPLTLQKGFFSRTEEGRPQRTSPYKLWLERNANVRNLVGLEYSKDDPRVARVEWLRPKKKSNRFAGFLDEFEPADPMASVISKVIPRKCHASQGSSINLFAGFGSSEGSAPAFTLNYSDPGVLNGALAQVEPGDLGVLANVPPEQLPALGDAIEDSLLKNPDPRIREKAALAIRELQRKPKTSGGSRYERRPAGEGSPKSLANPKRFFPALKKALKDKNPRVRGAAAGTLADAGDRSPDVSGALSDAITADPSDSGGAGSDSGNNSGSQDPLIPKSRAFGAKQRNNIPRTPDDLRGLLDGIRDSKNPKAKDRAKDRIARDIFNGDPRNAEELERWCRENPQEREECDEIARRNRRIDPEECVKCREARERREAEEA